MDPLIEAVVFDAYGTLFDVYSVGALAERLFPGHGSRLAVLWRDRQIDYTRLRTLSDRWADFRIVTADALDWAAAALGLDMTGPARERLLDEYDRLAAFPEILPALQRLRRAGLALAILSNGTRPMLESAVASAGLDGLFDHMLSADQVRRFKTAPELYQLAPDAFGRPAGAILFVSSNGWDACGATWFGFTSFWVNRSGLPAERLGVQPTGTGPDLDAAASFALARIG